MFIEAVTWYVGDYQCRIVCGKCTVRWKFLLKTQLLFFILQDNVFGCSFSGRSQNVYTRKTFDCVAAMSKSSHYWHIWSVCQCSFCVCRLYHYQLWGKSRSRGRRTTSDTDRIVTMSAQCRLLQSGFYCVVFFPGRLREHVSYVVFVHTRGRLIPVGKLVGLLGRKIFWQSIRKQE
jgi:hypothetical protein